MSQQDHDLLIEIKSDVKHIRTNINDLCSRLDNQIVTCKEEFLKKSEFEPIQKTFHIITKAIIIGISTGVLGLLGWGIKK